MLNEANDLLTATEQQTMHESSKLVQSEPHFDVLKRETNILKNNVKTESSSF
ncbi:hypothetical protein DPMN_163435 [Dreissena polymorpha]|uniref:Uncharacterized protein n=1 Tax=Dreissena polymorpha TaxID=45954 RepID=A0A9D4ETF0_DREPO|nr:hypothetical protein DPMN_163435 [Dreissena polymorpha]